MKKYFVFIALLCSTFPLLQAQSLSLHDGVDVIGTNGVVVVVNDAHFERWINAAPNTNLRFDLHMTGSTADSNATIRSDQPITFADLTINKSQNGIQLDTSIAFWGDLDLMNGNVDLNGQLLFFYPGGQILNEREESRIWGTSGRVAVRDFLNNPVGVNPANMGMTFTATENLGVVDLTRHHRVQMINGQPSLQRDYEMQFFFTGVTFDCTMEYFNAELGGVNEADLNSWTYTTEWEQRSADAIDTAANLLTFTGLTELDSLWGFAPGKLELSAKVLLEGNYVGGGLMTDALRANSLIPTTEPYTGLGYAHVGSGGETVDPVVLNVTGDNAIVDWIFLEFRSPADSTTVAQTAVALLQKDGDIVDLDGVSPLQIPNLPSDNYYLAIRHRNHLAIRSASKLALSPTVNNYDFSSSLSQAWDKPTVASNDAMADNGGVFLLHRCDNNGDGFINILDFILSKSNSTPNQSNVYLTYDINLDGNTNILDFILTKSESSPNKSAHID